MATLDLIFEVDCWWTVASLDPTSVGTGVDVDVDGLLSNNTFNAQHIFGTPTVDTLAIFSGGNTITLPGGRKYVIDVSIREFTASWTPSGTATEDVLALLAAAFRGTSPTIPANSYYFGVQVTEGQTSELYTAGVDWKPEAVLLGLTGMHFELVSSNTLTVAFGAITDIAGAGYVLDTVHTLDSFGMSWDAQFNAVNGFETPVSNPLSFRIYEVLEGGSSSSSVSDESTASSESSISTNSSQSSNSSSSSDESSSSSLDGVAPEFVIAQSVELPTGAVGFPYSGDVKPLMVVVGTPQPTFFLESGSLPPGVMLNTDGTFSGTPTVAGVYEFEVYASNAAGDFVGLFHIPIVTAQDSSSSDSSQSSNSSFSNQSSSSSPGGTPPVFSDSEAVLTFGTVGQLYASDVKPFMDEVGSPEPTFSLSSGSLPPGIDLNSDGTLTGTPTTAGAYAFEVYASNAAGDSLGSFALNTSNAESSASDYSSTSSSQSDLSTGSTGSSMSSASTDSDISSQSSVSLQSASSFSFVTFSSQSSSQSEVSTSSASQSSASSASDVSSPSSASTDSSFSLSDQSTDSSQTSEVSTASSQSNSSQSSNSSSSTSPTSQSLQSASSGSSVTFSTDSSGSSNGSNSSRSETESSLSSRSTDSSLTTDGDSASSQSVQSASSGSSVTFSTDSTASSNSSNSSRSETESSLSSRSTASTDSSLTTDVSPTSQSVQSASSGSSVTFSTDSTASSNSSNSSRSETESSASSRSTGSTDTSASSEVSPTSQSVQSASSGSSVSFSSASTVSSASSASSRSETESSQSSRSTRSSTSSSDTEESASSASGSSGSSWSIVTFSTGSTASSGSSLSSVSDPSSASTDSTDSSALTTSSSSLSETLSTDSSGSSPTSQSLSTISSTSSTRSSNTSSSSSSFSATSSSSSSWSSESSLWDQAPWYSICRLAPPTLRGTVFTATVELDLRHSDSVILQTIGPLEIDIGGEWGDTVIAPKLVRLIDGQKLSQAFNLLADALAWQEAMWLRIKDVMAARRQSFLVDYPADFDERHRLV